MLTFESADFSAHPEFDEGAVVFSGTPQDVEMLRIGAWNDVIAGAPKDAEGHLFSAHVFITSMSIRANGRVGVLCRSLTNGAHIRQHNGSGVEALLLELKFLQGQVSAATEALKAWNNAHPLAGAKFATGDVLYTLSSGVPWGLITKVVEKGLSAEMEPKFEYWYQSLLPDSKRQEHVASAETLRLVGSLDEARAALVVAIQRLDNAKLTTFEHTLVASNLLGTGASSDRMLICSCGYETCDSSIMDWHQAAFERIRARALGEDQGTAKP